MNRWSSVVFLALSALLVAAILLPVSYGEPDGVQEEPEDVILTDGVLDFVVLEDGSGSYAGVCGCDPEALSVVIPPEIGGYPVRSIETEAFVGCAMTDILIPDSVESIGELAFYDCNSITEIVVPESVVHLDDFWLGFCSDLARVYLDCTHPDCEGFLITYGTMLYISRDTVLPDGFKLSVGGFHVTIAPESMTHVVDDYLGVGISEYPKDDLGIDVLRTIMYGDCYEFDCTGLEEGTEMQLVYWLSANVEVEDRDIYTFYRIDGDSIEDIGFQVNDEGYICLTLDQPKTVFSFSVKQKSIQNPVFWSLAIVVLATVAAVVYLRAGRGD